MIEKKIPILDKSRKMKFLEFPIYYMDRKIRSMIIFSTLAQQIKQKSKITNLFVTKLVLLEEPN